MNLCDLNGENVKKPVLHYSERTMNKPVRHSFDMQRIPCDLTSVELYRGVEESDSYGTKGFTLYAFYPGVKYGLVLIKNLRDLSGDGIHRTVEEFVEKVEASHYTSLDDFTKHFDQCAEDESFIDILTIEFVRQFDMERAERYEQVRLAYKRRKEIQYAQEREKREAEHAAYVKEKNDEAEAVMQVAIDTIRNGGTVGNDSVEIFKSRYNSACYSLVNYLCRRYGISVPLRTQGWIAEKLAKFIVKDGKLDTCYYIPKKRNEKASTKYRIYLQQLIDAVLAEKSEA